MPHRGSTRTNSKNDDAFLRPCQFTCHSRAKVNQISIVWATENVKQFIFLSNGLMWTLGSVCAGINRWWLIAEQDYKSKLQDGKSFGKHDRSLYYRRKVIYTIICFHCLMSGISICAWRVKMSALEKSSAKYVRSVVLVCVWSSASLWAVCH